MLRNTQRFRSLRFESYRRSCWIGCWRCSIECVGYLSGHEMRDVLVGSRNANKPA